MNAKATDKICNALIELLKTKPLEDITVKDLVAKAKVNRSTYNYHYYAIDDVLDEVFNRIRKTITSKIYNKPIEPGDRKHHFVIKYTFEALLEHKEEVRILIASGYEDRLINMIVQETIASCKRHKVAYKDSEGHLRSLNNGPVYDMYIEEICYAMIPRIKFYLSYDFDLPISQAIALFKEVTETKRQINDFANSNLVPNYRDFNF